MASRKQTTVDVMANARPPASSQAALARMRAARQSNTAPEVAVRKALHAAGLRYRVNVRPLAELNRRADIVFRRLKVAVYVDGCFWHGCPRHGTWPKANASFWRAKILANRQRDAHTDRRLRQAGWRVVRIWEHEPAERAAAKVLRALER